MGIDPQRTTAFRVWKRRSYIGYWKMTLLVVIYLLLRYSHGLVLQEDTVKQSLRVLVSSIMNQMPKCLVVVMSDPSTLTLPESILQMRASPNYSELVPFLIATYRMKCTGYLVDEEGGEKFFTSLNAARIISYERHTPRVVVAPNKAGNYSDTIFKEREAAYIPDMISIQIADISKDEEVKFVVFTNDFQGNLKFGKGKIIGIWPTDDMNFFPDKIKDLKGKELIVSALHYPPYFLFQPQLDGTEVRLLNEFCRNHNCSLVFYDSGGLWGEIMENGTANGVLGDVFLDHADFGAGAFYIWGHHYVDHSSPYCRSAITVVVPKPTRVAEWKTVFLPFSLTMWILLLTSIAMATVVMKWVNNAASKISNELTLGGEFATGIGILFRAIGMSLLQPPPRLLAGSPLRRFFTIFEVLFLFFTTIYSGAISSVLTVPRYNPAIDSPLLLYEAGIPWAAVHKAFLYSIKGATEPYFFKGLLERFEIHDLETLISLTKKGGYAFIIEIMEGGHVPEMGYLSGEMLTDYHVMNEELYSSHLVSLLRKGSPYIEEINKLIDRCRAAGLFLLWESDVSINYLSSRLQTALQISKGSRVKIDEPIKLKIMHIQGAFILLAIGLCFSCFICFLERIRVI